jgi:3',5'-cyclic AMP phosphodiesterase CpdA
VYLHHSPVVGEEKWRKRLTDAQLVQQIIARHGAELVLHGHGHRALHSELPTTVGPIPVIAVPSGSAMGHGKGDTAAYNHYGVNKTETGWLLEIETRRYQADRDAFTADEPTLLAINRLHN